MLLAIVVAVSLGALAVYVNSATANDPAKFIVDNSSDAVDFNPGDGICDTTVAGAPGNCGMRAAIDESNALDGPNVINFTATNTTLGSNLPIITERLTIDASMNAGGFRIDATAVAEPMTLGVGSSGSILRGLDIFNATGDGLVIIGGASHTIGGDPDAGLAPAGEGNIIRGHGSDGIDIRTGSQGGHIILGNLIGAFPDGLTADGNGAQGILISGGSGDMIVIGGAFRNVIMANAGDGVFATGGTAPATVENNLIGLNANGAANDDYANTVVGVESDGGPPIHVLNNFISGGDSTPVAEGGILLQTAATSGSTILGNCVGFNQNCQGSVGGFQDYALRIDASTDNIVGDGTDSGRNVLGNVRGGTGQVIRLNTGADDTDVNGNYIGFGADGEEDASSDDDCVNIASSDNQIRNNLIGNCDDEGVHVGSGDSNVISDNDFGRGTDTATADQFNSHCIELDGAGGNEVLNNVMANCDADSPDSSIELVAGSGNEIVGNDITSPVGADAIDIHSGASNLVASAIFRMVNQSTGDLPIDLNDDQVTLNDPGDPDVGTNLLHNYPVFPPSSATDGCARGSAGPFDMVRIYTKSTDGGDTTYVRVGEGTTNVAGDFTICLDPPNTAEVTVVGTSTTTAASTLDVTAIGSTSEFSVTEQTVQPGATPTSTPTTTPTITNTPTITMTPTITETPTPTATFTPEEPTATNTPEIVKICGDVDGDGDVNAVDATLIFQLKAGLLSSLENDSVADVNDDGDITSVDGLLILQVGAGLITEAALTCPA